MRQKALAAQAAGVCSPATARYDGTVPSAAQAHAPPGSVLFLRWPSLRLIGGGHCQIDARPGRRVPLLANRSQRRPCSRCVPRDGSHSPRLISCAHLGTGSGLVSVLLVVRMIEGRCFERNLPPLGSAPAPAPTSGVSRENHGACIALPCLRHISHFASMTLSLPHTNHAASRRRARPAPVRHRRHLSAGRFGFPSPTSASRYAGLMGAA